MSDQSAFGRFQAMLILGVLASKDVAKSEQSGALARRRAEIFSTELDITTQKGFETFQKGAMAILEAAGFHPTWITKQINWTIFQDKQLWAALQYVDAKFQLMTEYQGTDCCPRVLVRHAQELEDIADWHKVLS